MFEHRDLFKTITTEHSVEVAVITHLSTVSMPIVLRLVLPDLILQIVRAQLLRDKSKYYRSHLMIIRTDLPMKGLVGRAIICPMYFRW